MQFDNVSIVKKANVYFDGQVTSRTVLFPDGTKKTLGLMMPGDFEFGTNEKELMEVLGGKVDIQLPGEPQWRRFENSGSFTVPANSKFKLKVETPFDYCCSYIKE